jgi:hypothetical protein
MKHTINNITLANGDKMQTSDKDLNAAILSFTNTPTSTPGGEKLNLDESFSFSSDAQETTPLERLATGLAKPTGGVRQCSATGSTSILRG